MILNLWQYNKIKQYLFLCRPKFCLFSINIFNRCSYLWLMNFSQCQEMSFLIVLLLTSKPRYFNLLSSKRSKTINVSKKKKKKRNNTKHHCPEFLGRSAGQRSVIFCSLSSVVLSTCSITVEFNANSGNLL